MTCPRRVLSLLCLAALALFSLAQFVVFDPFPPGELPAAAAEGAAAGQPPLDRFAVARAYSDLIALSQAPRPPGSPAHAVARDYLLQRLDELGLETQVQRVPLAENASELENVLGRLPGRGAAGGALLLVAHYDSMPGAPGAGDNASGVAVVLEILRAVQAGGQAGEPLDRDLLVLFSDGEELGMLGAAAFARQHPWMPAVQVALNFDTLTVGPALMWQTSRDNGWLVAEYGAAVRNPMAASWFYDLSRLLPLDTDLTPLMAAGAAGYNFSTGYLYPEIHSPGDQAGLVHPGSLQHGGEQGLALVRRLGQAGRVTARAPDRVFFNLWGPLFVNYPARLALPLAIGVAGLLGGVTWLGLRRGRLAGRDLLRGIVLFQATAGLVVLLALLVWLAGFALWPARFAGWLGTPNHQPNDWVEFGLLAALAVGVFAWRYRRARRSVPPLALAFGVLFHWAGLALLSAAWLPGASFLFTWPLLASLLAHGWMIVVGAQPAGWGVALAGAAPAVLLWTPFIFLMFLATALGAFPVLLVLVLLGVGMVLPAVSG